MRASLQTATIACLAVTLLQVMSPPAWAGSETPGDGTITGGDVSGPGDEVPADIREQAAAKMEVAAAYVAAKRGSSNKGRLQRALADYEARFGLTASAQVRRLADQGKASIEPMSFASNVMGLEHYPQQKSYYCGPASGKMILKWKAAGPSAYSGVTQNQTNIADANHMRTDINGSTSWGTGLFRIGINRWRQGTSTGYYIDLSSPTPQYFENSLVFDIDNGYPFGADTVEFAGGVHYNGHPANQTIGHWIVGHGYYDYGATARFADPSTSVWSTVNANFNYNSTNFTNRFLQSNGITW